MKVKEWYPTQRGYFAGALYEAMKNNKDIWLVTADLGYAMFDKIKEDFSDRYINVGAAEQAAVGIAVGLAQEGKIPFVYTITPFFLRAAETIGLYLHGEKANVKLCGSGRDNEYRDDGPSHNATLAQDYLASLDIKYYAPVDKDEVECILREMIREKGPCFLSLSRT